MIVLTNKYAMITDVVSKWMNKICLLSNWELKYKDIYGEFIQFLFSINIDPWKSVRLKLYIFGHTKQKMSKHKLLYIDVIE